MKSFLTRFGIFLYALILLQASAYGLSEDELKELYLQVAESAVDAFEPIWVDESDRIPNSGFYDFRQYPDRMDDPYATIIIISGNGLVQFCYAVLLNETDKDYFGQARIPREVLREHAIQSLRWCCLTSSYVEHPYPYVPATRKDFADGPYWRRQHSWRADEVGWLTLAASLLWNDLDEDTRKQVEAVLTGGATTERLWHTWYPSQGGNHDQIKQDLSSTMGAAFLFPSHPDARKFWEIVAGYGIDLVCAPQDFANPALAEGRPIAEWAKGWHMYPDYSSDHHGWCNLWYGSDLIFEGRLYLEVLHAATKVPIPETFSYPGNGFDGVLEYLKRIALPEGEPLWPHGNEYDAYYGVGLLGYCYGAVMKKDPVAAALEERAALLLRRHSQALPAYDYHRNSHAKAAMAYLIHKYHGPRAEPLPWNEAMARLEGVYHHRGMQHLVHRSADKIVSFAWGSISSLRNVNWMYGNGFCGFVFSTRPDETWPAPLVYGHPSSLIGEYELTAGEEKPRALVPPDAVYQYQMDGSGFRTAGLVPDPALDRYYAFHSFENGPTILLTLLQAKSDCQINWSGLPVYFFVREGLTPSRALFQVNGMRPLELELENKETNWWCVDNRIGMVFGGDQSNLVTRRVVGYNWARKESYKDKCDGVFVSPLQHHPMVAGEEYYLPAAIYTNTSAESFANSELDWFEALDWPEGWRGLITENPARPGQRYLAVTNFHGTTTQAAMEFVKKDGSEHVPLFAEGAPVLSTPSTIRDNRGTAVFHLEAMESAGDIIDLYAETLDGQAVTAVATAPGKYWFTSQENGEVELRLRYRGTTDPALRSHARVTAAQLQGENPESLLDKLLDENTDSVDIRFEGSLLIDLGLSTQDHTGPFVEIQDLTVREDNRVRIDVYAADASGIQSVGLYCDGEKIGEKTAPPYTWTHRPKPGWHTYHAEAIDASPVRNPRASFKQTIEIMAIEVK
ncbi:MAG TPA: Ig-like domain-containing protein [bacterium]|nr:Ig-like domain-containing protein [bacterium]